MIISRTYSAGEMERMPMITEAGLCTNDNATLNNLREYENEDVRLDRVPRRAGLTAKTMDGSGAPRTFTVADAMIGRFQNCIQVGRTQTQLFAPAQPIGPFKGKQILRYTRIWVQLQE